MKLKDAPWWYDMNFNLVMENSFETWFSFSGTIIPILKYKYGEREVIRCFDDVKPSYIASYWVSTYREKWNRLYDMYSLKYNPIENTDVRETETITDNEKKTGGANTTTTDTQSETMNRSNTKNGSNTANTSKESDQRSTMENEGADNSQAFVNAYNGGESEQGRTVTNSKNTGAQTFNQNDTERMNAENEERENGTDERTANNSGSIKEQHGETTEHTHEREWRRHGNIGVQTPADMLTKETEFWQWILWETIAEDIVSITCLKIY